MKRIIYQLSALFSLFGLSVAGVAPATAEKALSAKFPNAQKVKWGKEGANNYKPICIEGVTMSANF